MHTTRVCVSQEAFRMVDLVLVCCCVMMTMMHFHVGDGAANAEEGAPLIPPRPPWPIAQALHKLRSDLGIRSRYWPRDSNPCNSWMGIQCNTDGQVVAIVLSGLRRTVRRALHPSSSLDALQAMKSLHTLNLRGFPLPGPLPHWLPTHLPYLRVLDASSCSLTSSIPPSLGALPHLQILSLANNNLSGAIPPSLSALSSLNILDLSHNNLTGPMPAFLAHLQSLTTINLSHNHLHGPLPAAMELLTLLQELDLSNNHMTAHIPAEFGSISSLTTLDLSSNDLLGSIPPDLGNLTLLSSLSLSHNFLTGKLPATFGSLWRLKRLDLSFNNLTGALPGMALPEIKALSLSHNSFYGPLPTGIRRNAQASMDLSFNFFSGNASGGRGRQANCFAGAMDQRSSKECVDFYAKRGLALALGSPDKQRAGNGRREADNGKLTSLSAVLGGMLGGLGLILVVIILAIILGKQARKAGLSSTSEAVTLGPFVFSAMDSLRLGQKFSYAQLRNATKNFDPSNLIKAGHSGELYRGFLAGSPVVVKRIVLSGSSTSSVTDTLAREVELFERASHTRLVPLLGHCVEVEEEKFLVYKYMRNRDLQHALASRRPSSQDDTSQSLDWITRLKIAIGAAEGLCFLHHQCFPPIAHRDIQASSVLLDEQFEARLGSLSDAAVVEGDSAVSCFCRMSQSSNAPLLAGAPVSTCSSDVYCFGKLLLELITGHAGGMINGQEFGDSWLEWTLSQISIYDKESMAKVVDASLILDEDLLQEVWAMGIVAKSCLNPRPSRRPLMRYVLKALENPLKVIKYDHGMSGTSRRSRNSSYGSWNMAFFGSLRHSISDTTQGFLLKEEGGYLNSNQKSNVKQIENAGSQHVIVTMPVEISKRRMGSSEIFPEPFVTDQSLNVELTNANHL